MNSLEKIKQEICGLLGTNVYVTRLIICESRLSDNLYLLETKTLDNDVCTKCGRGDCEPLSMMKTSSPLKFKDIMRKIIRRNEPSKITRTHGGALGNTTSSHSLNEIYPFWEAVDSSSKLGSKFYMYILFPCSDPGEDVNRVHALGFVDMPKIVIDDAILQQMRDIVVGAGNPY